MPLKTSSHMTPKGFQERAAVSRETLEKLETHLAMLVKWQKAVNLVGKSTLEDPWRRHVWDCFQLTELFPSGARTIVDLGSGAGFPALVLAATGWYTVHAVEADERKCVFMQEVARAARIDIKIHNARIEDMQAFPADVITARALGPLSALFDYVEPLVSGGGVCFFPKGVRVQEELDVVTPHWSFECIQHPSKAEKDAVILEIAKLKRLT